MGLVYSEPVCQAAYDGNLKELHLLVTSDPTLVNKQDQHTGDTPLIAACRHGKLDVARYLLESKASGQLTNKKQRTCLHYVCKRTFSLLDYLMISILMPVLLLGFFIMLQKQRKNVKLMKVVLSSGIDINAIDYKGNTALHYACQRKSHWLVPVLLQEGAKTNIRNENGETSLDVATRLNFPKIIHQLRKTN